MIAINLALKDPVAYSDLGYALGHQSGPAVRNKITSWAMTKGIPDEPLAADHRWSALMAEAQAGDRAAYQTLLRECIPIIKSVARRRGISADRVDDVVQDVLLTVHRARQTYDPRRSFLAWMSTIADRRTIDLFRRTQRQELREVYAPNEFETHVDEGIDPAQNVVRAEGSAILSRSLATLPPKQREAVQHLMLEERSLADAAALTQRSKVSLKVNLHRALRALRAKMGTQG